ncbi:MAG: AraC family transcriptional regulator [Clostridia bacterium]|nr:AraC family transcriptional regulator [Clostridia bacterium]
MPYTPSLRPIPPLGERVSAEIFYEKRYTSVDDVTHDGEHIHDFYEIYVNISGEVSFLVEDTLYPIARGDVIITRPNEVHKCIYHSEGIHEHFCIWLNSLPAASERLTEEFGKQTLVVFAEEEKARLMELCHSLYRADTEDALLAFRRAGDLLGVLDLICRSGYSETAAAELPRSFSEIVDYITAHCFEPSCTVSLLCERFYISKSTLCRRFRRYFQTTPSDYIESRRLSEAKKQLLAGLSVQDVCYRCGFSDCSYFILRFRKKFGVTPSRFQRGR